MLVALSAYGGAVGLAGGGLSLGATIEARLPFGSPVLGGTALALLVAVPFTVLAWCGWTGGPRTPEASLVAGGVLLVWLLVEMAYIREVSFFHPTYALVGVAFVAFGLRARRQTHRH